MTAPAAAKSLISRANRAEASALSLHQKITAGNHNARWAAIALFDLKSGFEALRYAAANEEEALYQQPLAAAEARRPPRGRRVNTRRRKT